MQPLPLGVCWSLPEAAVSDGVWAYKVKIIPGKDAGISHINQSSPFLEHKV